MTRLTAVTAEEAQRTEAPAQSGESSDAVLQPDSGITDSGAFEIAEGPEESDGIEDMIQAAAEAVEDAPESAADPRQEPPEEDSGGSET